MVVPTTHDTLALKGYREIFSDNMFCDSASGNLIEIFVLISIFLLPVQCALVKRFRADNFCTIVLSEVRSVCPPYELGLTRAENIEGRISQESPSTPAKYSPCPCLHVAQLQVLTLCQLRGRTIRPRANGIKTFKINNWSTLDPKQLVFSPSVKVKIVNITTIHNRTDSWLECNIVKTGADLHVSVAGVRDCSSPSSS